MDFSCKQKDFCQRRTRFFGVKCPSPRRDLLNGVSALLRPLGHTNPSNEFLMQILLYGDKDFPVNLNKDILLLTLRFIHETGRFDQKYLDLSYKP